LLANFEEFEENKRSALAIIPIDAMILACFFVLKYDK
jgi:hypothetical protein